MISVEYSHLKLLHFEWMIIIYDKFIKFIWYKIYINEIQNLYKWNYPKTVNIQFLKELSLLENYPKVSFFREKRKNKSNYYYLSY